MPFFDFRIKRNQDGHEIKINVFPSLIIYFIPARAVIQEYLNRETVVLTGMGVRGRLRLMCYVSPAHQSAESDSLKRIVYA